MNTKINMMMMCPLLSMGGEKKPCIRKACMWFYPKRDDLGNPDECAVMSINRNLLDIRMTMEGYDEQP